MVQYRYFTVDILTGLPVTELSQYGVTCDKQVSGAGSYSGFLRLDSGIWNDNLILDGTIPGKHAMMVQRDGVNIWGGPIWSRTYGAEGKVLQINANTFESVFDHIIMSFDCIYQAVSQNSIITSWMNSFLTQDSNANNFGFVTTVQTPSGTVPTRTILIPAYEYHMASDFLQEIVGIEGGLDYTIDFGSGDDPTRTIRFIYLNDPSDSGAYFDYPGTISKYWMNEAGVNMAYKNVALGAGSGNGLMKSVDISVPAGWAPWGAVDSYPNIADQGSLDLKSASMARSRKPPVYDPTIQMAGNHTFTGWNDLGKVVKFRIQDARFPDGKEFAFTLTGWSLTPQTKDTTETLALTLQDTSS